MGRAVQVQRRAPSSDQAPPVFARGMDGQAVPTTALFSVI